MTKPRPWEVLRTDRMADFRVFSVSALHSERLGDALAHTFVRIDCADWVNVVPLTAANEVVMIRQFRHGAGVETLEIPGGMVDEGEDPMAAAARELLEETGYRSAKLERIGSVNPNPALFGNRLHSFVARDCVAVSELANDLHEETVVELVPVREIPELLRRGAIDHALVMVAFAWLDLRADAFEGPFTASR
jgi:ADP-ribose pyrophosphatase